MSTITFDTHKFVKKMQTVGFTEEQAEVLANEQKLLIEEKLSTKIDLQELEVRLTYQLTYRFGLMLTVAVSLLATLISFSN
jgi:hypothetical protein